ncbi:MAG: hypothetical protein K1563_15985 [Candidatus Thiodiazotropha sp. (ex. Lucinisca nassula)]|nr:hypothetical protein [Candidatus Thiodiazotropha sp. (ex. Lucinisca nassula)]
MSRKIGGLWIICDDLDVDESLQSGRRAVSINLSKTALPGNTSILSLISTDDNEINFIAVCTASKISGDLERKFSIGPAIELTSPLLIDDALDNIPNKFSNHIYKPTRRVSGIPPASWEALIDYIVSTDSISKSDIEHLKQVILSREKMKKVPLKDVIAYEHDAVAVSLETFQGSKVRQQYLSNTPIDKEAPFIKSLEKSGANVLEDHMIENDLAQFPGVEQMRRHLVGAVVIQTESGKLTLLNSNRTKIENTLGVDLVYYHHSYGAFVLIQYKRLTGNPEPIYRPDSDSSYKEEVSRMRKFLHENPFEDSSQIEEYRMNKNPFFFKFCNSNSKDHWSRMTPGMYIPLELWEKFIVSDQSVGPRGGRFIGYENSQRWLNNSEFVALVRKGWVGSSNSMSKNINSIIADKLAANRSVVYAIHEKRKEPEEHLRDGRGRFSSENDMDAI